MYKLLVWFLILVVLCTGSVFAQDDDWEEDEKEETEKVVNEADKLLEALKGNDEKAKIAAIKKLVFHKKDKRVVNALIERIYDADKVKIQAIKALVAIKNRKPVKTLYGLFRYKTEAVRKEAAIAVAKLGGIQEIDKLILFLKDVDKNVSSSASIALGKIGKPAFKKLCFLLGDVNEDTKTKAFLALKPMGKKIASDLIALVKVSNVDKKIMVIKLMGTIKDKRAVMSLMRILLTDKDKKIRLYARIGLEGLGKYAVPTLKATLRKAKDEKIRSCLVSLLCKLGDKSMIKEMVKKLDRATGASMGGEWIREIRVVKVNLLSIGEPALPELVKLLGIFIRSRPYKKIQTYYYTKEIIMAGGIKSVPHLIKLLRDRNKEVKQYVAQMLNEITKENFGEKAYEWSKWWNKDGKRILAEENKKEEKVAKKNGKK